MNIDLEKLTKSVPGISDSEICSKYSILLPIIRAGDDDSILFEVRSDNLNQPGEICFPGGRIEKDESSESAALRETSEELLLPQQNIHLVTELDTVVTPFNKILYPYIGILDGYGNTHNMDEVKEVFTVPLDYLLAAEPQCSFIDVLLKPKEDFPFDYVQKGRGYPWGRGKYPVYFYFYEDRIIWGLTAKILHNFITLVKNKV